MEPENVGVLVIMNKSNQKVTFIRKNGRIIPIKDNRWKNTGVSIHTKNAKLTFQSRKNTAGERAKRGAKTGALVGAIMGGISAIEPRFNIAKAGILTAASASLGAAAFGGYSAAFGKKTDSRLIATPIKKRKNLNKKNK